MVSFFPLRFQTLLYHALLSLPYALNILVLPTYNYLTTYFLYFDSLPSQFHFFLILLFYFYQSTPSLVIFLQCPQFYTNFLLRLHFSSHMIRHVIAHT